MPIKTIISIFLALCIVLYFIYFNDDNKQVIHKKKASPTITTNKTENITSTKETIKTKHIDKNTTNSNNINKETLYIQYRKQEYKKYKQEIEYALQEKEKRKKKNNLKLQEINTRNKNNLKYEKEYKIHNMTQEQKKEISNYKEMKMKQNIHNEMKKLIEGVSKNNSL